MGYENRYVGTPGAVNMRYMPDPKREYVVAFERLDGGLNISELDNRLSANESPDMLNLMWVDGALGCRDGQSWVSNVQTYGTGYACADALFWGNAFVHIGKKIYYFDPTEDPEELELTPLRYSNIFEEEEEDETEEEEEEEATTDSDETEATEDTSEAEEPEETPRVRKVVDNIPEVRGTFFRYNDWLMYKTKGFYGKIAYDPETGYSLDEIVPYIPTIQMNTDPKTGAGDTYQSENRLSSQKRVKFSAACNLKSTYQAGDGSKKVFSLGVTSATTLARVSYVIQGSSQISSALYTVDLTNGTVTFATAPASGEFVGFVYYENVYDYQLPIKELDSIDEVKVDGVVMEETVDYVCDLETGLITFLGKAPPTTNPLTSNTVEVVFTKANPDAKKAIDDCTYAIVYGGNRNLCIVLAGCDAQPNAYFWNGNTDVSMDAGYFPFESYNLGGDTEDAIVGFGKQQNLLVVFKKHGIGKASYSTTTINDLVKITLDYEGINSRIGCDLPWSIQLIENNLVFANTQQGVFYIKDSSSAYENNIICISTKVNGSEYAEGQLGITRLGLLHAVRNADTVCSFDDGSRYWICTGDEVYAWDYTLSKQDDPSWFKFDNIAAVSFFLDDENRSYHLNAKGQLTQMVRTFSDYDGAINKYYQFAVQNFGSYSNYKNVNSLILAVRSDTDSLMNIKYITDWEERYDLTPIMAYTWRLVPRNLLYRYTGVPKYATVARRRPGCRNVRHFTLRLENNTAGNDMSVISGQFFYTFKGRQR